MSLQELQILKTILEDAINKLEDERRSYNCMIIGDLTTTQSIQEAQYEQSNIWEKQKPIVEKLKAVNDKMLELAMEITI